MKMAMLATALIAPPASAGVWGLRAPLLENISETAVTELDGEMYVMGVYPPSRITVATVQVYEAASDSWSLATPLPRPLNHAMAASVNGKVYLIGGQTTAGGESFVDTVYEYDPVDEIWNARAPMPTARSGAAVGVIDGKVYVAGGRPPRGNDFAVYDPVNDTWQTLTDMPSQRNHVGYGVIDGKLYVAAGRLGSGYNSEQTDVLEAYDPVADTWTTLAPIPTARSGMNSISIHGRLHTFGGESSAGVFEEHEAYDPVTNTWQILSPMPTPVHGVSGAVYFDGWIHLPGGGTRVGGSSGSTIHQVYFNPRPCPSDIDGNGQVEFADLLAVLAAWGAYEPCPPYIAEDIGQDCNVGFDDLLTILAAWGPCE